MNTRKLFSTMISVLAFLPMTMPAYTEPENTGFADVTAKLDLGGSFFMYTDLKNVMNDIIDELEPLFLASGDSGAASLPAIARSLTKSLGLDNMADLGMSMKSLDEKNRRMKIYLRINEPAGLFQLRGGDPYELDGLKYAPADAILVTAQNTDFTKIENLTEQAAQAVAGAVGVTSLRQWTEKVKKEGVDLPAILASCGGEWGAYFRLDQDKSVSIPISSQGKADMPAPHFIIMLKVKDKTIFDTVVALLKKTTEEQPKVVTKNGMDILQLPARDNPFGLKPVIAQTKEWLFLASDENEVTTALETASQKKGIGVATEYQSLMKDIPSKCNGVAFVSARFGQEASKFLDQLQKFASPGDKVPLAVTRRLLGASNASGGRVVVRINDPQGILWIAQGQMRNTGIVQAFIAAPLAASVAIAVPNFMEAGVRSKVSRTRADMRSMATALESYYVDYNAYPASTVDATKTMRPSPPASKPVPCFKSPNLTTPIAYITQHMPDSFAEKPGLTFGYLAKGNGWILVSPGPDMKFDINWEVYDPAVAQPSIDLISKYTYDPTNGTVSVGDIWRVKQ
ncbi:MAG: hypothetical protein NTY46_05795 [Candidatus Sumerlaeota bacterium]|nr:hypothetical protein [Candidatus Sumerlaeota bacterium]